VNLIPWFSERSELICGIYINKITMEIKNISVYVQPGNSNPFF
jgi:hypothetical protein